MHPLIKEFEAEQLKTDRPYFRVGDVVRVSVRIVEGGKERIQDFEGICVARKGSGSRETFTVRRMAFNVGMERIFPIHSPRIEKIKVVRRGQTRRAKLYYLRERRGRAARLTERRVSADKLAAEAAAGNKAINAAVEELEEKNKQLEAQAAAEAEAKAAEEVQAEEAVAEEAPAEEAPAEPQAEEKEKE